MTDSLSDKMQSLPQDTEALRALILTTFAERDAAVTERDVLPRLQRIAADPTDAGHMEGRA